jgi:hypothetical protein
MWNVKTNLISVTAGAIGTISNSFRQYLTNVPGKHAYARLIIIIIIIIIIIRNMYVIRCCNPRRQECDSKRS